MAASEAKTHVVVSGLLSCVALALMGLQLHNNEWHIDIWAIVLLGIAAFPWFAPLIESVAFPGGSVKLRELQRQQERQGEDIKALKFLMSHFLSDSEYKHLHRLAAPEPFLVDNRSSAINFMLMDALEHHHLVRKWADINQIHQARSDNDWQGDLKNFYELTDRGREYLRLRDAV